MNTTTKTASEIVSTRTTFDGVRVSLHADGSVSDAMHFLKGGKLPAAHMWRAWGDVSLYTHSELPEYIRSVKGRRLPWQRQPRRARKATAQERRNAKPSDIAGWRAHLSACRAIHCKVCG